MIVWWSGSTLLDQFQGLSGAIAGPVAATDKWLSRSAGNLPDGLAAEFTRNIPTMLGGAADVVTTTFGILVTAAAVFFLGGFFAWEPNAYERMFISLVPYENRESAYRALSKSAHALRYWLLAQSVSMIVVFVFTLVALTLIGMPYPFALAF
jgi:predicted PurR-regulated permease PerM